MDDDDSKTDASPRAPSRFQFKLISLMLAMILVSILAATFGGLFRPSSDGDYKSRLVLLTLMVPTGLLVFFGVVRWVLAPRRRRPRRW